MASTITVEPLASQRIAPPPLENGDRLTRVEFERRYSAMSKVKKAELIEGIVHIPSPVKIKKHARPHGLLVTWLGIYDAATPGVEFGDNATVHLDGENDPQPDVLLRILPECGGQTRDTEDGYVEGAPELVAEVASSSASYDLHDKKRAYLRNRVCEYLVWLVDEERVERWEFQDGEFVNLTATDGILKSRIFPGLWLNVPALLARNSSEVLATLQKGLATLEHAAYVNGLKSKLQS